MMKLKRSIMAILGVCTHQKPRSCANTVRAPLDEAFLLLTRAF